MKFIPTNYAIEEGKEKPEGTVIQKCKICGRSFAVPGDVASQLLYDGTGACEDCKDVYEKQEAEKAAVELKADMNSQTSEEINKALGN